MRTMLRHSRVIPCVTLVLWCMMNADLLYTADAIVEMHTDEEQANSAIAQLHRLNKTAA